MTLPTGEPRRTHHTKAARVQSKLVTVTEAAAMLSVGETFIWACLRTGRLTRVKLGARSTRISRAEVEALASGG